MMKPQAVPYICDLSPYQPGLPAEFVAREYGLDPASIVKLASNENPLGPSPKAKAALRRALAETHRYPEQYNLVQALARHHKLDPAAIVIGNGSNDVLDLIARTFLNDGDEAVSSQFAFAVYAIAAQSAGARNVVVPAKSYGHDLDAMLAAVTNRTRLIWIANPNNPTGTLMPYAEVRRFIKRVPENVVVVLDEAYYEYLAPQDRGNAIEWLADCPNLILVRTFSKIYGLAGLRVGYGLMHPHIADLLNRVRQPFNVNVLALAAAAAALEDAEFVEKSAHSNANERRLLVSGLKGLGLQCLPAYGNFVTFKAGDAAEVTKRLLEQGVIVRPLGGYGMPKWLRVTIGTPEENGRFLNALSRALAN